MKLGQKKRYVITLKEHNDGDIAQVISSLAACGFTVERVMDDLGIVTGITQSNNIHVVKQIQDVESVEEDTQMGAQ
ncbi:hypothetical protein ACFSJ3_03025 [Corallincola platygyrae]|uniref:Uncharacterized protein n=1 Tax=Corallincola platygyrae TaxID=1193278 RepID=A0ABW4XI58_9GAMM